MKKLLVRVRGAGYMVLLGFILIFFISLGILYIQQGPKQRQYAEQNTSMQLVVNKPLQGIEKLVAEYDEVNRSLAPIVVVDVLDILVDVARESGINIDPKHDKFLVPNPGKAVEVKVGAGKYQILPFKGIKIQGDKSQVMDFIGRLDSGTALKTMVLSKVFIEDILPSDKNEEPVRIKEFKNISDAVAMMMDSNKLSSIPYPAAGYSGGKAINNMTTFPDSNSGWTESAGGKLRDTGGKPYGTGDKQGYVLYSHDIKADGSAKDLVNYFAAAATKYYYTCEAYGKVRQFKGPDVKTAIEYELAESPVETRAILDVNLYSKLPEVPKSK